MRRVRRLLLVALVGSPFVGCECPPRGARHEAIRETSWDYYTRPRAHPATGISPVQYERAFEELKAMHEALHLPHVPPGASPPGGTAAARPCIWTSAGPTNLNGRITGIATDRTTPGRIFVASVGGIWRSSDSGETWRRVSDSMRPGVIGAVAVNPGDANEVFAGGGNSNLDPARPATRAAGGPGMWQSKDGGDSWTHVGPASLDAEVIFRIRIDPDPPHDVYAATSMGVWIWERGGNNPGWKLLGDPGGGLDAASSDIVVDFAPAKPVVYAGVYKGNSTFSKGIWKFDGASWGMRSKGIPVSKRGKVALAMAESHHDVLYAKIAESSTGKLLGVFRTATAAEVAAGSPDAWDEVADSEVLDDSADYTWYNCAVEVDPTDEKTVFVGGMLLHLSTDGGETWKAISQTLTATDTTRIHDDVHAIAFDPTDAKRVLVGNDGGLDRSTGMGTDLSTWRWEDISHGVVITEFYRLTTQQAKAPGVAGGTQDNGSPLTFGNLTWYAFPDCDGAYVALDAPDRSTLCLVCTDAFQEMVNPVTGTAGASRVFTGFRGDWGEPGPPFATDPKQKGFAIAQSTRKRGNPLLLKTDDGIEWGRAMPTNQTFPAKAELTCLAICPSSSFETYYAGFVGEEGGPPAGIWSTHDGGATKWFEDATGVPNLSPNAIAVDWDEPDRAFAALGGGGGGSGSVIITVDGGKTWRPIVGSGPSKLPSTPVTGVAIDPLDGNLLYVSTHVGVFRGKVTVPTTGAPTAEWAPFDEGLPEGLDVNDIAVNREALTLLIGSMGYGVYQRSIDPAVSCADVMVHIRDNVFDQGLKEAPSGEANPEDPVADGGVFYKPNDAEAGKVYWWTSTDIRIDVPTVEAQRARPSQPDHVEFESYPIQAQYCPPGFLKDVDIRRAPGFPARVYVQVANRGTKPATNLRVAALWTDATTSLPPLPGNFWSAALPAGSQTCGTLAGGTGWNWVDTTIHCRTIARLEPGMPEVVAFDWKIPGALTEYCCIMAIVESADDPLAAPVRLNNDVRPRALVQERRQIAVRNLHVVDVAIGSSFHPGSITLLVPNHGSDPAPTDLLVSFGGLSSTDSIGVLLPALPFAIDTSSNLNLIPAHLDSTRRKQAVDLGLDPSKSYQVRWPAGVIPGLPIPPGQTWKVQVNYAFGPNVQPGTASRFTIVARQRNRILGGSTYVLRLPR